MLRKSDCSEKDFLKKAAALKKELLRKSNSCVSLEKVTLKKCEEVVFPIYHKHMRKGKLPFPDLNNYSWRISCEYLTGWP